VGGEDVAEVQKAGEIDHAGDDGQQGRQVLPRN
jgi:hypothetical protein